jgi:hypothetical protein
MNKADKLVVETTKYELSNKAFPPRSVIDPGPLDNLQV